MLLKLVKHNGRELYVDTVEADIAIKKIKNESDCEIVLNGLRRYKSQVLKDMMNIIGDTRLSRLDVENELAKLPDVDGMIFKVIEIRRNM